MARESKRKREERRFGLRQGRLIDLAADPAKWSNHKLLDAAGSTRQGREELARLQAKSIQQIGECVPVVADNVCEFLYAQSSQEEWIVTRDFPNCSPPFSNMFIEFGRPSRIFSEGQVSSSEGLPKRWGWHLVSQEDESGWHIGAMLYVENLRGDRVLPCCAMFVLDVERNGVPKKKPGVLVPGGTGILESMRQDLIDTFWAYSFPALLAISFMNCKNVATTPVDPDPAVNRERRKAGLKPFLRYHTINIEPMKRVLRTEGNIESEGLKKALHICRGHFATYTQERPLFGHFTGTVWKPSHVRGSAKQGVVVSDYEVKAPA